MKNTTYYKQAELLLRVMPAIAAETCFALKGGTAINFFIRDLPRLSVDIDLSYLPIESRELTLTYISAALERISQRIQKILPDSVVQQRTTAKTQGIKKLIVKRNTVQIKIEPNEIIRGSVFPVEERDLVPSAEELFGLTVSTSILSLADLYGGKICAALDRQHPRDLFDIKLLLDNEGLTREIRQAFVIYLASHNRPMHELFNLMPLNLYPVFQNEFSGMATVPIEYESLLAVRDRLIKSLLQDFTEAEKYFLLSIKEGQPRWDLFNIAGIDTLPAIQWKLKNIHQMSKEKHKQGIEKLKRVLKI